MPIVKIEMRAGKTAAYKKALEVPMENLGVLGGKPASEVDLGFNVKV